MGRLVELGWRILAFTVAVVASMWLSTATPSAHASVTRYDGSTIARVDVHQTEAADAGPALLSSDRERSGSPRAEPSGTSTTLWARSNATNKVDDILGATCRANSFVPGTRVLMADGTTKPVEDVRVGDSVWATEPETGRSGPRRVLDTIAGGGEKDLVDVTLDGAVITATDGHPFWVDDQGRWVDAEQLEVGDRLLLSDGSTVAIEAIASRVAVQQVHNLSVDEIHTYHVVAEDSAVVVHNQGGPCLDAIKIAQHADEAGHVVPGVDDLAQYVDDVLQTPGTSITRGRTAWWDPATGAVVIREADGYGTVFVPDRGYDYYLDLLAE